MSEMRDCYVFDVDGTLALKGDRDPYDYSKILLDRPQIYVVDICRKLALSADIIILSGRMDVCRDETIEWLDSWKIPHALLLMRKEKDFRADEIVKEELYTQHIKPFYKVLGVFDDRPKVNRVWRELELPLFMIGDQTKEF